ncbi:MAG: O-antigen polymerase [Candidatus Bilamarchaeaceae archaeon]
MILEYSELLLIDLSIWLTCLLVMLRWGSLSLLHPATLYFCFHAYTFTFRLFQLSSGAPTLFGGWGWQFAPVTGAEIQRASWVALGGLITMTVVWLYLAKKVSLSAAPAARNMHYRPFSRRIMWMVCAITLPIGLFALVVLRGPILVGGSMVSLGAWSGSGYLFSIQQWFGISLLALIFYYGLRPGLLVLLSFYLAIALLTFPFRMMVILPALFVMFTYVRRNNIRWLSWRVAIVVVTLFLLFVSGKEFGPLLRHGYWSGTWELLTRRLVQMQLGEHIDATFMDQMAVVLSQVEERGHFYYGRTYANLLFLPIPRQLWPDKPGQADWQKELQTPGRPTGDMGAIATALGEAYANFGYAGVVLYSMILAALLHALYVWMMHAPYYSLVNFWSLCVYAILIQVFRDGLISFVIFQVSTFMPLTTITLLHLLLLRHRYNIAHKPMTE